MCLRGDWGEGGRGEKKAYMEERKVLVIIDRRLRSTGQKFDEGVIKLTQETKIKQNHIILRNRLHVQMCAWYLLGG